MSNKSNFINKLKSIIKILNLDESNRPDNVNSILEWSLDIFLCVDLSYNFGVKIDQLSKIIQDRNIPDTNRIEQLNSHSIMHYSYFQIYEFINTIISSVSDSGTLQNWVDNYYTSYNNLPYIETNDLDNDLLGTVLQMSLDSKIRKVRAVNYTQNAEILMELVNINYAVDNIIDPFVGSGRLITAVIDKLHGNTSNLKEIVINDIMPSSVLVAYTRIMHKIEFKNKPVVIATYGDAFVMARCNKKYSLIVINPPFTRSMHIENKIRANLLHLINEQSLGHAGLHVWAIILATKIIRNNGQLFAILPSSILLSQYAKIVHKLLLDNYYPLKIINSKTTNAFSQGSSIKEIVLYGQKSETYNESMKLLNFINITKNIKLSQTNISYNDLQKDWNWDRYFRDTDLLKLRAELLPDMSSGSELSITINRGIEMYGPNFYFLPNKKWRINEETNEYIIVDNGHKKLKLSLRYLQKVLRRAGLYKKHIFVNVHEYILVISPDMRLDNDLKQYIKITEDEALVAKKKFGENWLYHTWMQITKKHPYSNVFIIDKLNVTQYAANVFYSDNIITCTKNFNYIKFNKQYNFDISKLFAAWFNSGIYLLLYLSSRREINGSFGRLLIIDYYREPLFPSKILDSNLDKNKVDQVLSEFDKMNGNYENIIDQIRMNKKEDLDKAIIDLFGLNIDIKKVHNVLLKNLTLLTNKTNL